MSTVKENWKKLKNYIKLNVYKLPEINYYRILFAERISKLIFIVKFTNNLVQKSYKN